MATMVKESRKEKKKTKSKSSSKSSVLRDLSPVPVADTSISEEIFHDPIEVTPSPVASPEYFPSSSKTETTENDEQNSVSITNTQELSSILPKEIEFIEERSIIESNIPKQENVIQSISSSEKESVLSDLNKESVTKEVRISNIEGSYKELSNKLERMAIPENAIELSGEREFELLSPNAYLQNQSLEPDSPVFVEQDVLPSAPCLEEIPQSAMVAEELIMEFKPKVACMPIEDVMRLYSGGEMEDVRAMSEREEEIVEAGPVTGPEHPLVDLLSTFRSSLMAVERERILLANGFTDEERSRNKLWKVEKRHVYVTEKCPCGSSVELRATYEHAELVRERLPAAKMRLVSLLRDLQDSYCHHQHATLLAYYQIEELISETIQSNKSVIREALSLVLVALRQSACGVEALASALQRWAGALAAALVDHRDLRQLLFIMHHLFKQSRSVRWASRVIQVKVDIESPPRILALLELLLARPRLDTAQECTEEDEEVWEEVDKHGDGGAVSEGTLRERDLLALLYALPIRDLVARILLFTHNDIRQARAHEWADSSGGRGVLRACYGVRSLLQVLRRAAATHASYARLKDTLRDIAACALHGLACLHISSCEFYAPELQDKLTAELEASFFEGFQLFESRDVQRLPATLLADVTAKNYCLAYIEQLHEAGVLSCADRVRIVSQAAVDREFDHELARLVLGFLLQTGLRHKVLQCKGICEARARECVPQLLTAHPYLHTMSLHMLADMNIVEALEVSCVKSLHVPMWRPTTGEARALLDDWSRRCPLLLHHLLLEIDFTPYRGLALDVQLTIGTWICSYVRSTYPTGVVPECWWSVLRRLRTHRSAWLLPIDAPPPDEEPTDLFSIAYALLSTSWGHCIPLICSEGVSALSKLSASRPREATHCLAGIMFVMAHSPESLALTPKFNEVFSSLLNSGPSLVARALGRGGVSGGELLLRLILAQLDNENKRWLSSTSRASVFSAWLNALWRVSLPVSALTIADSVACLTRQWPQLDAYANALLQEETSKDHINHAVKNAYIAPLLCECLLRVCHTQHETLVHYGYARLLNALQQQRAASQKIHVDNALQQVSANISSEELVIYRVSTAALVAPLTHPSHLTLWRLLLHLYLQRAPDYMNAPPVGPLFFSGLLKSRTLTQIKRRLQETITYHHNEAATLKSSKSIDTNQPQSTKTMSKSNSMLVDGSLLPSLTIVDLTGESASDSESGDESRSESREETQNESFGPKADTFNLITYHSAAEKMVSEYLCWLEEGEKVRAMPHHADIARFIPEHALEAAWKRAVSRPQPSQELDEFPLPTPRPPPDTTPAKTPLRKAVDNILKIKDRSRKRYRRTEIQSPVEDIDFRDARTLLSVIDKHLRDIERLAEEWCTEVSRICSLDDKLWELVSALRVNRPIPPVRKQCPQRCAPITIDVPGREWCISLEAECRIADNRRAARAAVRRLARPRTHAAQTHAAILATARRVRSSEAGVRVAERAWCCAGANSCGQCSPARSLLTALVTDLAEQWVCNNGRICSKLISAWGKRGSSSLQYTLCGALVSPRRLPHVDWPVVYTALLDSHLPSNAAFSYLSKFEMYRWSETADPTQRHDVLEALSRTIKRYGSTPPSEDQMLVEILGVHTALVMTSHDVPVHVKSCVQMSIENKLPYTHWTHVVRAVDAKAYDVPFDQLGHLLRELGVMWWEARTGLKGSNFVHLAAYAPYVAKLLHALQRAFVAAATKLSYAPERVAWYAWSALQESWGAWITPHTGSLPLLPSTGEDEQYTAMLRHFVDNVHQIMLDCPGTEISLLQQIFEWCVQTYVSVQTSPNVTALPSMRSVPNMTQESRVQASALLAELSKLPWSEHQWFFGKSLQVALQMSTSTDPELTSWCSATWQNTKAETLLRDVENELIPRLASLLYLFTGTLIAPPEQILEEACKLPWHRLPELALEEALGRFFVVHHSLARPYHDLPQFRLILQASELAVPPGASSVELSKWSRGKRALCVSSWVRGATAPALAAHVHAHCAQLLRTLTSLAVPLSSSENELEDLLSRALVIMCIEPAASIALPVWLQWVGSSSSRVSRACVSAASSLTVFEHAAALGDAAVRAAMLTTQERANWVELSYRWSTSPWREAARLVRRARLHAAYASALCEHQHEHALHTVQALLSADIHFIDNEVIVSVWICYAYRWALDTEPEVSTAARSLLARWGEEERRSLLSRVTMQLSTDKPTAMHRLLCRYAQYLLISDETSRRSFENTFLSALGTNSDLATWTIAPQPKKLVSLAIRLFPKHDNYFQYELEKL